MVSLFGKTKKAEKGKGLIEIMKEQLAEVNVEMTALTDECEDLWQQYLKYQANGETLKELEVHGQWKYKRETAMSELRHKREELVYRLGGVATLGESNTGLLGEANRLQGDVINLGEQLKDYDSQIEVEERRFAERIERIERGKEEAQAEIERNNQRLKELLGG